MNTNWSLMNIIYNYIYSYIVILTGEPFPSKKNSSGKIHVTKCLKSKSEIQEIQSGFDQKKCTEITT